MTLPPGRAKLAANPDFTGSELMAVTIGIVEDAFIAGRISGPLVTMTFGFDRTTSPMIPGDWSNRPCSSRMSRIKVLPST